MFQGCASPLISRVRNLTNALLFNCFDICVFIIIDIVIQEGHMIWEDKL
jgi:hypothetical protein